MPHRLTLARMSDLIRNREISALELVDAHAKQIERVDSVLRAFVRKLLSEARAAAIQSDNERAPAGPLHGIPVTVKDSLDMRDLPTLCGSRLRLGHRAPADSAVVRRLKDAGAIIIGKTNCPEFLLNYETDNHLTGWTANPWNVERSAGGSSGGESAAIAACCSAGGIGSDGGGSIRIPAHFCGIAGLKPTPGRISAAGHYPQIAHPGGLLGVVGPMARTAEDVRLLFRVLAGYDPDDPFSAPVPVRMRDPQTVRVGVLEQFANVPVLQAMREGVQKATAVLEDLGIAVDPFDITGLENAPDLWWFFFAELSAPFTSELLDRPDSGAHWSGLEFLRMQQPLRAITGREVVEKLEARDRLRGLLLSRMRNTPVLLLPACGVAAFRYREREWTIDGDCVALREAMSPATVFNLVGFPAMVIPFGFTREGLPVGIQLVGRPWEEELILDLAVRMEEARGRFPLAEV
jgi:Asp-tRNA(Asn)/Glu-tRNA(Gln) amidotransferase A subunit family amidase